MPLEIERKFLVTGDFKPLAYGYEKIIQGYIVSRPQCTVRIRRKGGTFFLTIKGESDASGLLRLEWEKEITEADFGELLQLCDTKTLIEKTRYYIKAGNYKYEVDEFYGRNQGLVMAEIELPSISAQFEKPSWIGREVTGNTRYYNSRLSQHPYTEWKDDKDDRD